MSWCDGHLAKATFAQNDWLPCALTDFNVFFPHRVSSCLVHAWGQRGHLPACRAYSHTNTAFHRLVSQTGDYSAKVILVDLALTQPLSQSSVSSPLLLPQGSVVKGDWKRKASWARLTSES